MIKYIDRLNAKRKADNRQALLAIVILVACLVISSYGN